ncbi:MAG TPA: hypothetical protein VMV81_05680 [Phycisphaerae bacterium]|nr:hypothetical protein [Phycisphaerae bacterium]
MRNVALVIFPVVLTSIGCTARMDSSQVGGNSPHTKVHATKISTTQPNTGWHQRITAAPRPQGSPQNTNLSEPLITRFHGGVAGISREQAFEFLLNTDVFAASKVGFGMETPEQVVAFRKLLAEPDAAEVFNDLVYRARLAGQMYALCGLRITDRPTFDRLVERYRSSDEMVRSIEGCIGGGHVIRYLIESPQHRDRDIQGGGWSTELAGRD